MENKQQAPSDLSALGASVVPDLAAGRVLCVGVDLTDVGRVRALLARHPERFARRVLSEKEAAYCLSRPDPAPHIAARFAAKEAVIKCLGGGCALSEIEVERALSGAPSVALHGRAKERAAGARVLISLSHLEHIAAAFAVLVTREGEPAAPMSDDNVSAETIDSVSAIKPIKTSGLMRAGVQRLEAVGLTADQAQVTARVLLQDALGLSREELMVRPERAVTDEEAARYDALLARRERREPLSYILGWREFFGLPFSITPAVLVPRQETEHLVEAVLAALRGNGGGAAPRVADIGTGSGIIAVALAATLPEARVLATDISPDALTLARENAERNRVADRVAFFEGDLLAPVAGEGPFDAIASNPPYIAPEEIERLQPEVRDWEPRVALGTHADPLHFYRRLAAEAPPLLAPGGLLAVEVGMGQAQAVAQLWRGAGLTDVSATRDYAGIERVVTGRRHSGKTDIPADVTAS